MSFYDNFTKRDKISRFGKYIILKQNQFYLKLINKYSSSKKVKILEIGSGKGYFAEICKKNKFDYCAIEANYKMYRKLKNNNYNVYNQTIPPINLKNKFDVIFANQVFEHFNDRKEILKVFEECKKNLNKKGLLIISVPDITYFKEDCWGCDYTHNFPLSLYSLKQILIDFDFKIKYANVRTLFFNGYILTKLIKLIVSLFYNLGIIKLIFNKKSYKIKNLGNASCIVVGINNE